MEYGIHRKMLSRSSFATSQNSPACSRLIGSSRTTDPCSVSGTVIFSGVAGELMLFLSCTCRLGRTHYLASFGLFRHLYYGASSRDSVPVGLPLTCDEFKRPTVSA